MTVVVLMNSFDVSRPKTLVTFPFAIAAARVWQTGARTMNDGIVATVFGGIIEQDNWASN